MKEAISYSKDNLISFFDSLGYSIPNDEILRIYPTHFENRYVFRRSNNRVIKARINDSDAQDELTKIQKLISSYRFSGTHFEHVQIPAIETNNYLLIDMPFVGHPLLDLATVLDYQDLGYGNDPIENGYIFKGFTSEEIRIFISNLHSNHLNFAYNYGLIHGDIFQLKSPNNTLFNISYNQLFFIDAEALAIYTDETQNRFCNQIEQLEEWMHEFLLVRNT